MNKPFLCTVDPSYLLYLRAADKHVSEKPGRPFVANVVDIGGFQYAIPLTTQVIPASGKPRAPMLTSIIANHHGREIGALLYNNMIPVTERNIKRLDINTAQREDESRYIRSNEEQIAKKAETVYRTKVRGDNHLCNMVCLDYKELERCCSAFNQTKDAKTQENTQTKSL